MHATLALPRSLAVVWRFLRAGFLVALIAPLACAAHRVAQQFPGCRLERRCGELFGVDCHSAVDGDYHYVRAGTLEVIATCGGACIVPPQL